MARQLNLQGIIFANGFLEGWYGGFFSKACEGIAMDMYIFDAPIGYLLSLPEPNVTIFFTAGTFFWQLNNQLTVLDENPWVELDDGRVLSTADGLLGGIDLFILAFAVFKLFRYVRYQKSKYIPILTLSFVVIGAIRKNTCELTVVNYDSANPHAFRSDGIKRNNFAFNYLLFFHPIIAYFGPCIVCHCVQLAFGDTRRSSNGKAMGLPNSRLGNRIGCFYNY